MDVLKKNKGGANPGLSTCIDIFCRSHKRELTSKVFQNLTDATVLPEVSFGASFGLMKLEKSLVRCRAASSSKNGSDELTCLQQRCVKAIVPKWSTLYQVGIEVYLLEIGLHVYRKIMRETLLLAQLQLSSKEEELKSLKKKLPRSVIVSCSGNHTFKGCYTLQDKLHGGAPKYATDTWEIFFSEDDDAWYLSKLGDDPDNDEKFYYNNDDDWREDGSFILPPKQGWKRVAPHAPVLAHPGLELCYSLYFS